MKAIAVCQKCGKKLETDCEACVDVGTDFHMCKNREEGEVVDGIKWEIVEK